MYRLTVPAYLCVEVFGCRKMATVEVELHR